MDTLVSTDWLAEHLDDPDLVVLDCAPSFTMAEAGDGFTVGSGRAAYQASHIPEAGFADIVEDLSDTDSPLQFAMPTPEAFCASMGALGVGDDSRVVLYDREPPVMWASRVWWMLRWVGFDQAALLDGGMPAWSADGRPSSAEPVTRPPATLTPAPRPRIVADRDEVLAAIGDGATCVVDTFHEAHYRGDEAMYGRPGHVPGAANMSAMALFDETGRFRPADELAALATDDPAARTITYCGGGIMASTVAFALTRLGFDDVAVYAASLQEWASDPANPMEVGAG